MCLGGSTTDSTKSTTNTPNPAVASAATSNLSFANNLQNSGFQPYSGNQVAGFSPLQQQSLDSAGGPAVSNMIGNYANAGPGSVSPNTISSAMNPYLNQYVNYALAPQLQGQQQQFDAQNRNLDAAATSSGAFGDARAGIEAANLTNQQNLARQGLIGNAYNAAFNTAIGAGAQDVSNNLQGQTTNANLNETALNRQLTGANALQGNIGFQNTLGQQGTAQTQAGLNAQYNQWLMGQQRPFQTAELANQTLGAASHALPANSTTTSSSPDNSGYGMIGSALGAIGGSFFGMPGVGASIGGALGGAFGGNSYSGQNNLNASYGYGAGYDANGNPQSMNPPGYADGGDPPVGQPAIVGERGPEVFVPHNSAPSSQAKPDQQKPQQPRPFGWPPHIPGMFADGGEPPVGQPSIVGERGPELFVPHQPGTIIPHEAVAAAAAHSGASGFAHAFGGKPNVVRHKAIKNKAPMMMPPPSANGNMSNSAFGQAA